MIVDIETPLLDETEIEHGDLIPLLQQYQRDNGYISEECVQQIAEQLNLSENHIYGVASFYSQFRLIKPGKHTIRVCRGTACHVQAGQQLSNEIQSILRIFPGETTQDGLFELEEVACLGCCAQAPVLEIDGKIYGKVKIDNIAKILKEYE